MDDGSAVNFSEISEISARLLTKKRARACLDFACNDFGDFGDDNDDDANSEATTGKRQKLQVYTLEEGKEREHLEGENKGQKVERRCVRQLVLKKTVSDNEMAVQEGCFATDGDFGLHIGDEDVDCYTEEGALLFKFRKRAIPPDLCALAHPCFMQAAMYRHGGDYGPATGRVSLDRTPPYVAALVNPARYVSKYISQSGKYVNKDVGNVSHRNVIGFIEAPRQYMTKKRRRAAAAARATPGASATTGAAGTTTEGLVHHHASRHATAFTRNNGDLWKKGLPLIRHVDSLFKKFLPDEYATQHTRAQGAPVAIEDTAFTTVNVSCNWQTAIHADGGDLCEGLACMAVFGDDSAHHDSSHIEAECGLSGEEWSGGKVGFPQYGVCIDVRTGDFLAMDANAYHCNTPLDGASAADAPSTRLAMFFYIRKKML